MVMYPLGLLSAPTHATSGHRRHNLHGLSPEQRGLIHYDVDAAATPILLVHGFIDNHAIFTVMERALRRRGFHMLTAYDYGLLTHSIPRAAIRLGETIERLVTQSGYEGDRLPFSKRGASDQFDSSWAAAIEPHHLGGDRRFIDKHQPGGIKHSLLTHPVSTRLDHVGAVLFLGGWHLATRGSGQAAGPAPAGDGGDGQNPGRIPRLRPPGAPPRDLPASMRAGEAASTASTHPQLGHT
jgi:hypothetical protein